MAQQPNHGSSASNTCKKRKSTICRGIKNKKSAAVLNQTSKNELKRNMAPPPKLTQPSTSRTVQITELRFPSNLNITSFPEYWKNTSFTGNVQNTSKDVVQQRNHDTLGSDSCRKRKSTICPGTKNKNTAVVPNQKFTNELKRNMAPSPKFSQPNNSRTVQITEFSFRPNANITFRGNVQNTSKNIVQQRNHDFSGSSSCKKRKSSTCPGIKNKNSAAALNQKLKLKGNMAPPPKFTQPSTSRKIPITEFSIPPNVQNISPPQTAKDILRPPSPNSGNPVCSNTQSAVLSNLEIDFKCRIMPECYTSKSRSISRNELCSTSRNDRPEERQCVSLMPRRCCPFTAMSYSLLILPTIQEEDIT